MVTHDPREGSGSDAAFVELVHIGTAQDGPGRKAHKKDAGLGGRADLLSMEMPALKAWLLSVGEKPFRAKQIFAWLHEKCVGSFAEMTNLSKALREKLEREAVIAGPTVAGVQVSRDGTRKYQLETTDGHLIEAVFLPNVSGPGRNALCISSQVGCAMGCTFCATAALKLKRNLRTGEIVGQLYAVHRDLEQNLDEIMVHQPEGRGDRTTLRWIDNIVYMGMGEPLHNFDAVHASIGLLTSPRGQHYSGRRLTVSTSGLVKHIVTLGETTDVHIAISLNASTDAVRDEVMPVNRKWKIRDLIAACKQFPADRHRRITFEYVLLKDVNDTDADAKRVKKLLSGMRTRVNLIPYNAHPLSPFARPDDARVQAFQAILRSGGVDAFVRTTRGDDIDAACGMLGAKKLEAARAEQHA